MEAWAGRVAVVTGAGTACGRCVAAALLRAGLVVVGVAADVESLKGLIASGGQRFYAREGHPEEEEELSAALDWTAQHLGGPHLLVQASAPQHFAAADSSKTLLEAPVSAWRSALDAGVVVRAVLAKEFALLTSRRENTGAPGVLLHVHSCPQGEWGLGAAARAADRSLCEALRQELNIYGLRMRVATLWLGSPDRDVEAAVEAVDVASALCLVLTAPSTAEVLDVLVRAVAEG